MAKSNGLVLAIGINEYGEDCIRNLDKACIDAKGFSDKMHDLGFEVVHLSDIDSSGFDEAKAQFIERLQREKHQTGVFFFAGHGIEIDKANYLLVNDSVVSTGNPDTMKRYAIDLQRVVEDMHKACDANVIIIDACRDNPFLGKERGMHGVDLAAMHAPKGTIIAYSTSPGETASEGLPNDEHSPYTTALLHHLEEPGLDIERMFKKVRLTLDALTHGKQTSWEHTSLIGNIVFNKNGGAAHQGNIPYSKEALQDREWNFKDEISDIVSDFRSHTYRTQSSALKDFLLSNIRYSPDQLFVIGRNIMQSACGGEWSAKEFLDDIEQIRRYNEKGGMNHLLNGMLYEVYFNSFNDFRDANLKIVGFGWMMKLLKSRYFTKSFEFIADALSPYADTLLFIPGSKQEIVNVTVTGQNEGDPFTMHRYVISDIVINGISVLTDNPADQHPRAYRISYPMKVEEFKESLSLIYGCPAELTRVIFNETPVDERLTFTFKEFYSLKQL